MAKVGLENGRLRDCPNSPNCVCSQTKSETHFIAPLKFSVGSIEACGIIKDHVLEFPRVELIQQDGNYFHFVFTSGLFKFKDDVEILVDDQEKLVHFRSASRIGYGDLGANRKRVENLKRSLAKAL